MRMTDILRGGITRNTLYAMRDSRLVVQMVRGLYRLAEMAPLSQSDLLGSTECDRLRAFRCQSWKQPTTGLLFLVVGTFAFVEQRLDHVAWRRTIVCVEDADQSLQVSVSGRAFFGSFDVEQFTGQQFVKFDPHVPVLVKRLDDHRVGLLDPDRAGCLNSSRIPNAARRLLKIVVRSFSVLCDPLCNTFSFGGFHVGADSFHQRKIAVGIEPELLKPWSISMN